MHIPDYIGHLRATLSEFAKAARRLEAVHFEEAELVSGLNSLARMADEAMEILNPFAERYGEKSVREPAAVRRALFNGPRPGAFVAIRDLHGLTTLAAEAHSANTVLSQAAQALRDADMMAACGEVGENIRRQQAWPNAGAAPGEPHGGRADVTTSPPNSVHATGWATAADSPHGVVLRARSSSRTASIPR